MEQHTSTGKYSLLMKCIAVVLTLVMTVNFTLTANAAETKEYVREVILVVAKDKIEAEAQAAKASEKTDDKRTYYVLDTPVYDSGTTKTWLCYATTTKPGLALTSVKAMNMKGGWKYDKYNEFLETAWQQAGALVDGMLVAVREYNTNLAAGKAYANYAKGIFDLLKNDADPKKVQLVSEFFAEAGTEPMIKEKENAYKTRMTEFVMESNTDILCSIQNALMIACADTKTNLLTTMEDPLFLGSVSKADMRTSQVYISAYDSYVADILSTLPEMQEYLSFYEHSGNMYTDAMETVAQMEEDQLDIRFEEEKLTDEQILEKHDEYLLEIRELAAQSDNPFDLEDDMFDAAKALYIFELYYNNDLTADERRKYNTGRLLHGALSGCEYLGYYVDGEREYLNLLGLFERYDLNNPYSGKTYENCDFYPLLQMMSDGQRAMLKVGITQLISSVVTGVELLELNRKTTLEALNAKAEEGEEIKEGDTVSVYYGVDRTLFEKDSGIAMTGKAIEGSEYVPLSEDQAAYAKMDKLANYTMIASAATIAVTTAVTLGMAMSLKTYLATKVGEHTILDAGRNLFSVKLTLIGDGSQFLESTLTGETLASAFGSSEQFAFTYQECLKAFISSGGIGTTLMVINIVAIAAFIIAVVIKIVAAIESTNLDTPYIDIPRVMCSYQEVFSESGTSDEEAYIYYYGVKNPLLSEEDQKRAAEIKDEYNKETTYILKYKVADVANWTLHGENREWIALYASTDAKAGKPILAGSFTVTTARGDIKPGYTPVEKFNLGAAYDLHTYYGFCAEETVGGRFLAYKMDTAAAGSASVFSVSSPIGTLIAGILAGGAVGALITYFVFKKRKSEIAES